MSFTVGKRRKRNDYILSWIGSGFPLYLKSFLACVIAGETFYLQTDQLTKEKVEELYKTREEQIHKKQKILEELQKVTF